MKGTIMHMIGNAHLDPVWLWQWQEGFQEAKATFRSALDRMNETEEFVFTSSSAALYEWVENSDPAMFDEIRLRIKEGRWHIAGGWWIQPDCNIPGGESYVRQGLYGQRYFSEKFGVTAKVGYNVDSFGHNGMLPQILVKSGMDYYVFMRPMPGEKALPSRLFKWESDDGSQVLAYRILFEYLTWSREVDVHVKRCAGEVKPPMREAMVFYGVGNHGGGPTKLNISSIQKLQADETYPKLIFSDPLRFFTEAEKQNVDIPVVHTDLQHHASGCYSAHSGLKRWNRKAENELMAAEKFSSLAHAVMNQKYPDFSQAWKNVLFNQFHDILAGTSIETACDDALCQYAESVSVAQRGLNYALQAFSWAIGIEQEDGMRPVVVFNPCAWESLQPVEVELPSVSENAVLTDCDGHPVAYQLIQPHASCNGRFRICFMAKLPALGYTVYKLKQPAADGTAETPMPAAPMLAAGEGFMENTWYRLEFDTKTGLIQSLREKERDTEIFKGPAAVQAVMRDESDTWSHDVLRFNDKIGEFTLKALHCIENGPVRCVTRVISEYENSVMIQDFILYAERKQIDVKVRLDWHGKQKAVKLLFPVNLNFNRNSMEIPYGFIEREGNGEEEPMQNWCDMSGLVPGSGKGYTAGVALLNDGKYSVSVEKNVIGLTLLRSPIYAHHVPYVPKPDMEYVYIDQGIQTFQYTIYPHDGNWEDAPVVKAGWELNQPPRVIIETFHDGALPLRDSFAYTNCDNVLISVIKKEEDGDGLIVRAYECCKRQTEAEISLPFAGRSIRTMFKPCEIKTFRIPVNPDAAVTECSMTEL